MSKTKDKILAEALRLFNENGLTDVSLRTISDAMNISVGNLQYHFKKREDIVETLYFQLAERINASVDANMRDSVELEHLFALNHTIAHTFFEYRFFFLEFVAIIRNHERIKGHYQRLTTEREAQFLDVMEQLVAAGIARSEFSEGEHKRLYQQIEIVSNFWLSSASLKTNTLTEAVIAEHAQMIGQCLMPYLHKAYTL